MAVERLTERELAAYTLLGEAAGEGVEGMRAVMHVINNRKNSGRFPPTLAGVILQRNKNGYQFSTWSPKNGNSPTKKFSKNSFEFKQALNVVDRVLAGLSIDNTKGSLYYYAGSGPNAIKEPRYFKTVAAKGTVKVGNHVFASGGVELPQPTAMPASVRAARAANANAYNPDVPDFSAYNPEQGDDFPDFSKFDPSKIDLITGKPLPKQVPGPEPSKPPAPYGNERLRPGQDYREDVKGPARFRGDLGKAMRDNSLSDREDVRRMIASRAVDRTPASSGLTTRSVTTVPVRQMDPYTAENFMRFGDKAIDSTYMRYVPPPRTAAEIRNSLQDNEAMRQQAAAKALGSVFKVRTTVNQDNKPTQQAGTVVMKPGARPSIDIVPPLPRVTPSWTAPAQQAMQKKLVTRMVTKTVKVTNPEWGKVNPAAIEKLQDIHDREEARRMAAQIPQFIEQQIQVPITEEILVPAPGGGARAPAGGGGTSGVTSQVLNTFRGSATGKSYAVGQVYTNALGYQMQAQADGSFERVGAIGEGSTAERYERANRQEKTYFDNPNEGAAWW